MSLYAIIVTALGSLIKQAINWLFKSIKEFHCAIKPVLLITTGTSTDYFNLLLVLTPITFLHSLIQFFFLIFYFVFKL